MTAPGPSPDPSPRGRRDRRGRGRRGPDFGPPTGPDDLVDRVPAQRSRRERFDDTALAVMDDIVARWERELALVELVVEEIPLLPATWSAPQVPLGAFLQGSVPAQARVVLYRRPIEQRADTDADVEALVLTVLVDQLCGYLGVPPERVHPDYED